MKIFGDHNTLLALPDRPGAYAIIKNANNQIAIMKTRFGHHLPGGGQEKNETLTETIQRELLEETGHAISMDSYVGQASQICKQSNSDKYFRKVGNFYIAQLLNFEQAPTEVTHKLIWMSPNEACNYLTYDFQKWAIEQALMEN